jgi:diphthine synthase
MLYLVGLGIWDEKDMSMRGIEICKKADRVYAELYTSSWGGDLKKLAKIIKKDIKVIGRRDLEERSGRLVREAKKKDVVVLIPGDPLSATTHGSVVDEASKAKVKIEVVHSSSVFTAIAEAGISLYNFGKTVTVVTPSKKYKPDSFYKTVQENKAKGTHTLLLLDIKMSVNQGLEVLLEIEGRKRKGLFKPNTKIIVASSLGSPNKVIKFGPLKDLIEMDFPPPAVIIYPGRLNFFEKEILEKH